VADWVIAGLLGVLVAAVLWAARRTGSAAVDVGALRDRLDGLVRAQEQLPRTVAEGTADQARALADVRERLARLAEATQRIETLGHEVGEVHRLLRVPQLRGAVGEVWLEELLGQVLPNGAYAMQHGFRTGERVDAVIRVGSRVVPVDAKFPLESWQRLAEADGEERVGLRRQFVRALCARVDEIASKYIRPDEGTFDFALMYLPAEAVYTEAVTGAGAPDGLMAYALERHVIPVSPHTFYAYLTAILHGLRGLEVEERAREILDGLQGLRTQFEQVARTHGVLGRHLENAGKQFDEAARQLGRIGQQLDGLTGSGPVSVQPEFDSLPDEPEDS
jgi:DNA recombination protein RmuC